MTWETYELMFDLRVWAAVIFVAGSMYIGFRDAHRRRKSTEAAVARQYAKHDAKVAAAKAELQAAAWEAHAESLRLEVEEMERIARGEDADTDEWNERDDLAARVARLQPQDDGCPF